MSLAKDKLAEIGTFKDNWNGYGAKAYSELLIKYVSDLLDTLPVEPQVFPIADTGIMLEIKMKDKREIEIDVWNDFKIDCTLYDGETIVQQKKSVSMKDILRLVGVWVSIKEPSEYPRM